MKLRIKGNSLRLRVTQTEMALLAQAGSIEETIRFGPEPEARLTYALAVAESGDDIRMEYKAQRVTVVVSRAALRHWSRASEVGIYGESAGISLVVEKDFACLDGDDPVDEDAFPNPKSGVAC
jgi:hypothetical protein